MYVHEVLFSWYTWTWLTWPAHDNKLATSTLGVIQQLDAWRPGFHVLPAHKISWTWILHMFGFFIALDCAHDSLDTRENTMWSITSAICTSRKHLLPWWWSNLALLCLWHTDEEGCINWFKLLFRIFLALKIKMQMTILRCWWRRQLY